MRLSLGDHNAAAPGTVLILEASGSVGITPYLQQGYTDYDVICIGAAGGNAGSLQAPASSTRTGTVYGGAGGGGGFHRVTGKLLYLPALVPVVVGLTGFNDSTVYTPATYNVMTAANPGGYSSFNGSTCRASGGMGGKKVSAGNMNATSGAGGAGGRGNQTTPGGGAAGGTGGYVHTVSDFVKPSYGADGDLSSNVGSGGGGGGGGIANDQLLDANAGGGGRGSYSDSDTSVFGPGGVHRQPDPTSGYVLPGAGGGAKATPLTGLARMYGSKAVGAYSDGVVVIKFTRA